MKNNAIATNKKQQMNFEFFPCLSGIKLCNDEKIRRRIADYRSTFQRGFDDVFRFLKLVRHVLQSLLFISPGFVTKRVLPSRAITLHRLLEVFATQTSVIIREDYETYNEPISKNEKQHLIQSE